MTSWICFPHHSAVFTLSPQSKTVPRSLIWISIQISRFRSQSLRHGDNFLGLYPASAVMTTKMGSGPPGQTWTAEPDLSMVTAGSDGKMSLA